jgi:hypothetical protein
MTPEAPSATDLMQHPAVQAAFAAAWADSLPDDPAQRHEEGGYIYVNATTGDVLIRRAAPGQRRELNLSHPPELQDCFLVGRDLPHAPESDCDWLGSPPECV